MNVDIRIDGNRWCGYVEFANKDRDAALEAIIGAVRAHYGGDIGVCEDIPNDKGFIERPGFFVSPANRRTKKTPQFVKSFRNCHRLTFVVKAGDNPVAPSTKEYMA